MIGRNFKDLPEDMEYSDKYLWSNNKAEFFENCPQYYRYYVEGYYDYPEGFAEDPDEDHSFTGYLTYYFRNENPRRYFVTNEDRTENQFFQEFINFDEVVKLLADSRRDEYMVVTRVSRLTYRVAVDSKDV